MDHAAGPAEVEPLSGRRAERSNHNRAVVDREGTESIDVSGAGSTWRADRTGWLLGCGQVRAAGQLARQQAEADGDPIGMQPVADEVIEVMAMEHFVDGLLDASALTVQRDQPLRGIRAEAGEVDPRPAPVGRGAGPDRELGQNRQRSRPTAWVYARSRGSPAKSVGSATAALRTLRIRLGLLGLWSQQPPRMADLSPRR